MSHVAYACERLLSSRRFTSLHVASCAKPRSQVETYRDAAPKEGDARPRWVPRSRSLAIDGSDAMGRMLIGVDS